MKMKIPDMMHNIVALLLLCLCCLLHLGQSTRISSTYGSLPPCQTPVDSLLTSVTFLSFQECIRSLCPRKPLIPRITRPRPRPIPRPTPRPRKRRPPPGASTELEAFFDNVNQFVEAFGVNIDIVFENGQPVGLRRSTPKSYSRPEREPEPEPEPPSTFQQHPSSPSPKRSRRRATSSRLPQQWPRSHRFARSPRGTSESLLGRLTGFGPNYCDASLAAGAPPPANDDEAPGQIDEDVCCQTEEFFFINSTLTDIFGRVQTIAQFNESGSFQFIRHGVCGSPGFCLGVCEEKLVTQSLVIDVDTDPPINDSAVDQDFRSVTYSFFDIPGYCICRILGF